MHPLHQDDSVHPTSMAFSSTSQLHPTSLHSISKLHSFPLPFLLRSPSSSSFSSIAYKQLLLSNSTTLVPKPQPTHHSRWIDKWKHTQFPKLPKKPRAIVDYRGNAVSDDDEDVVGISRSTGSSTMEKIVEKLKRYGYIDDLEERKERSLPEKGSVEDIFYAEDEVLPNSRGGLEGDFGEVKFPWEKVGEEGGKRTERKKVSKSSVAELTVPEGELRRLRHLATWTKSKTKIGGAGVTKEIVDKILEK